RVQHFARLADAAYATGDAKRNVDGTRHALDPAAVDAAPLRARRDVVEHELVGARIPIAQCQLDDIAHVDVIAKAHALDDAAVAHVEARDDASAQHASASASVRRPSSRLRPSTTPATPAARSARTSPASRTPPDACTSSVGASFARCA